MGCVQASCHGPCAGEAVPVPVNARIAALMLFFGPFHSAAPSCSVTAYG